MQNACIVVISVQISKTKKSSQRRFFLMVFKNNRKLPSLLLPLNLNLNYENFICFRVQRYNFYFKYANIFQKKCTFYVFFLFF